MKNLIRLSLGALLFVAAISCNKDSEEKKTPTQKEKIQGEWKMTGYDENGEARTKDDSLAYSLHHTGGNYAGKINLKSDYTYEGNLTFDINANVTRNGNTTSATLSANFLANPGTWELDGNSNIIFNEGSNPVSLEIANSTETALVLKGEEELETILINGDSATERSTIILTFTK